MPEKTRIYQIDALRGFIMVLMALDHFVYFVVRFHPAEFWNTEYPEFPALFLQVFRLLTHLCAPGFVFLAGVSMQLAADKKLRSDTPPWTVQRGFLLRGCLLILAQVLLETPAWLLGDIGGKGVALNQNVVPGTGLGFQYLGVLFTLGTAMILGSFLIRSPNPVVLALSACAILLSPAILLLYPDPRSPIPWPAGLVAVAGRAGPFYVTYPILPWLGMLLLGILTGRWITGKDPRFANRLLLGSLALVAAGAALKAWHPWGESHKGLLELSKYPPSLAFLALTLGVLGTILWSLYRMPRSAAYGRAPVLRPAIVLGGEPLFFYFLHLYAYGLLCQFLVLPARLLPVTLGWLLSLVPLTAATALYGRWKQRRLRSATEKQTQPGQPADSPNQEQR